MQPWNLLANSMANTALVPVSSVECHISLLPKASSGIFFQLHSKAFLFMCFKCWAPRLRIKISQSLERRGNEKLRLPNEILCPPVIPLIWKNKGQQQRQKELGTHSGALAVTPVPQMESWCSVIFVCLDRLWRERPPRTHFIHRELRVGKISLWINIWCSGCLSNLPTQQKPHQKKRAWQKLGRCQSVL